MRDADLDLAVDGILWSAFGTTGQRCTACSRVVVDKPVVEALVANASPDCRVVIEAGDIKPDHALRKACEKSANAVAIGCYPDAEADLGRLIDDDMLEDVLVDCEQANDGQPITFFEITTVAAFLAFARVPADLAIVEVGMGGRLDTTNVVDPLLTAITPIGYDHTQFLGDTLEKIAAEKAGILKHAVPAVIGRQREASAGVIAARAGQLAAPLFRMGREWQVNPTDRGFRYESDLMTLDLPAPALAGAHQLDNAGELERF